MNLWNHQGGCLGPAGLMSMKAIVRSSSNIRKLGISPPNDSAENAVLCVEHDPPCPPSSYSGAADCLAAGLLGLYGTRLILSRAEVHRSGEQLTNPRSSTRDATSCGGSQHRCRTAFSGYSSSSLFDMKGKR